MSPNHNLPDWLRTLAQKRTTLQKRSLILSAIRSYFLREGFIEVNTPRLVVSAGLEPHLEPFETVLIPPRNEAPKKPMQLPTSPEFAMKKLLAAGFEKIFDLGVCFRNAEGSELHEPEFIMLEWYRAGGTEEDIMRDCEQLTLEAAKAVGLAPTFEYFGKLVDLTPPWQRVSCKELFAKLGVDLGEATEAALQGNEYALAEALRQAGIEYVEPADRFDDAFFKVFLTEFEPNLGVGKPVFLTGYPAPMAAYAKLDSSDPRFARRFELYMAGIELANAFFEVNTLEEQLAREKRYRHERNRLNKPPQPEDPKFHEALKAGFPPTCGIALGIDRLVMLLLQKRSIQEVIPFPHWTGSIERL